MVIFLHIILNFLGKYFFGEILIFFRGNKTVAITNKKLFRIIDTYGIEIFPGEDNILVKNLL